MIFGKSSCAASPPLPGAGWWSCTGWTRCRARRRGGDRGTGPALRLARAVYPRPDPYLSLVRQALGPLRVPRGGCTWNGSCRWRRTRSRRRLSRTGGLGGHPVGHAWTARPPAAGAPGARMLDVLIDQGLDPPFSCRQGICGACACQLTTGEVEMAHNEVLEAGDVAEG